MNNKENAIKEIENLFNSQLNSIGEIDKFEKSGRRNKWWEHTKERGYVMEKIYLKPEHLKYVLEEKKAFIKWFLTTYPQYNIPYNPKKRNERILVKSKGVTIEKTFWVKPARIARERDLLFGTNDTEIVNIDNWRDKIRNASSDEEVENIKGLFNSEWEIDNFVNNVKKNVDGMVDSLQRLYIEMNDPLAPNDYNPVSEAYNHNYGLERKDYFSSRQFKPILNACTKYVYNKKFRENWAKQQSESAFGSAYHGSQNAEAQFHQAAGIDYSYFVAYDLLKRSFDSTIEQARQVSLIASTSEYYKSSDPTRNHTHNSSNFPPSSSDTPELVSWNPTVSSQSETPISDSNSDSGSDSDNDTDITTPDSSSDEEEGIKPDQKVPKGTEDKKSTGSTIRNINSKVSEQVSKEEEEISNSLANSLAKAQSKNATTEDFIKTIEEANKGFGSQNLQTQQEQVEIIKKNLFKDNPELYREIMVKEVKKILTGQEVSENELSLTDELKSQWEAVKSGEIKEQTKIDDVVQLINVEAVQQGAAKKITYFQKKVHEVVSRGNKEEIRKLYQELLLATEKMKANIYQKTSSEKSQTLLAQLETHLSGQNVTTNPNKSLWVPISLAVVCLLTISVLVLLRKNRKKENKN